MKHETKGTRADWAGQVRITFTNKQLTAWGGACSVVAKFLERIGFREWVLKSVPVEKHSPNAKGIYEKVLALLLTSLTGGTRFSPVTWWSHGMDGLKACFEVSWLPQATSVLTRFFGKFRQQHNEGLRTAAVGLVGELIEQDEDHGGHADFRQHRVRTLRHARGSTQGLQPEEARAVKPSSAEGGIR